MPSNIQLNSLISLLGREIHDTYLLDKLMYFGAKVPISTEEILDNHYLELKSAGISFAFEKEDEARHPLPYSVTSGALILTSVNAYGASEPGYTPFAGDLPGGITFDMSRAAVAKRLGKPDWSSPMFPVDRWHATDHRLIVDFLKESSVVSIELP